MKVYAKKGQKFRNSLWWIDTVEFSLCARLVDLPGAEFFDRERLNVVALGKNRFKWETLFIFGGFELLSSIKYSPRSDQYILTIEPVVMKDGEIFQRYVDSAYEQERIDQLYAGYVSLGVIEEGRVQKGLFSGIEVKLKEEPEEDEDEVKIE